MEFQLLLELIIDKLEKNETDELKALIKKIKDKNE